MYHYASIAALLLGALGVQAAPSMLRSRNTSSPQCWYGNAFPVEADWLSFEDLFSKWTPVFKSEGSTDHELGVMEESLKSFSEQAGINPAFVTAMMVQESQGNTCRVCGDGGVSCGLLQVKGSTAECENGAHPCPDETIKKMIQCGTIGCGVEGQNVQTCFNTQQQDYGATARCYNSGSVLNPSDLRVLEYGDRKYVHLIANILLGADHATLDQLGGAQCGF